ncbi:sugar/nucleoside kinase (ribokinase family) [Microbacterium resistens]|uniref:Sugar/nucleoside kinase (Ribokinase family) n=1 Tax=Microbacterium resistens TaxID=156977 RepID=A0ABU1SCJ4_9MICO|nr:hypothetical protein [Microbacterium resistens]MDR6867347.1 sugar/nucleoside kinase (ribokinase family) [Microbacterium resistens]
MEGQVIVIGGVRIDEIRDPRGLREVPAGRGLDVARVLASAGIDVTVLAGIAEDQDGAWIRSAAEDAGVRLVALNAPEGTPRRRVVDDGRTPPVIDWCGTVLGSGGAAAPAEGDEASIARVVAGAVARAVAGARVVVFADSRGRGIAIDPDAPVTVELCEGEPPMVYGTQISEDDRVLLDRILTALEQPGASSESRLRRSLDRVAT